MNNTVRLQPQEDKDYNFMNTIFFGERGKENCKQGKTTFMMFGYIIGGGMSPELISGAQCRH